MMENHITTEEKAVYLALCGWEQTHTGNWYKMNRRCRMFLEGIDDVPNSLSRATETNGKQLHEAYIIETDQLLNIFYE